MHVSSFADLCASALALAMLSGATRAAGAEVADAAPGTVSGEVRMAGSGAAAAGARVQCGNDAAVADSEGRFTLSISAGTRTCEVSATGYATQSFSLPVPPHAALALHVALVPEVHVRESVEVSAPSLEAGATTAVAPVDVASAAGAAENVFRALQTMPGVAGANEYQSRLAVRGGGPDQNLTVMDGIEIHNPFRLDGTMSAFNPETVTDFELTAGAFSARYGDRLSSILVVRNRGGAAGSQRGGSASLGMTDGNVVVDGALPGGLRGTWIVAARQTYYDLIAERVVRTNLPGFRDVQARSTLELPGGRRLTLFALTGREWADTVVPPKDVLPQRSTARTGGVAPPRSASTTTVVVSERVAGQARGRARAASTERVREPESGSLDAAGSASSQPQAAAASKPSPSKADVLKNLDRFILDSHNDVLAATLESPLGRRVRWTTTASLYVNDEDQTLVRRRVFSALSADRGVGIRDRAVRSELTLDLGRHALNAGFETHSLRTRWAWTITGLRADDQWFSVAPGGPSTWGRGLPAELDADWAASRRGAWIEDRIAFGARGTLRAGLRVDHAGVNGEITFSPRLLATWHVAGGRVYAGAGQHYQSPGYEKLVQGDYFFDLTGAVRYANAERTEPERETPVPSAPTSSGTADPAAPQTVSMKVAAVGARALQSARSLHLVTGIEQRLGRVANLRVEAYHKTFDRLTVGRLETEEERRARVARYDFPAELADSVPVAPQVTRFPVSNGRGRAYGVEVVLSRTGGAARPFDGWLSYSYGLAEREAYGLRFPFDYDRRHALALVAGWQARRWLRLGVTARVASGFPRTPEVSRVSAIEDAGDHDRDGNRSELVPRKGGGALVFENIEAGLPQMNSERYPHYARVDARATFMPGGRGGRLMLYLDVINVLNRRVPIVQVLPILPSIGAHWRF